MTHTHTPTPWAAEPMAGRGAWIKGANQNWAALSCGETDSEGEANAAYIVHCVNSHASLVEENKRMREALEMTRATVGDLRKGFASYVTPERWVEQLQSFIDEVLGGTNA